MSTIKADYQESSNDILSANVTKTVPENEDNRLQKLAPKGNHGFSQYKYFMVRVRGTYLRKEKETNEKQAYDISVPMELDSLLKGPLGMFLQPELGHAAMQKVDPQFENFLTHHLESITPIDDVLEMPLEDQEEIDRAMIGSKIPELMSWSQMKQFIKEEDLKVDHRVYPDRDSLCFAIRLLWKDPKGFDKQQRELLKTDLGRLNQQVTLATNLEKFGFQDNSGKVVSPPAKPKAKAK